MAKIAVISPNGKKGFIPEENIDKALEKGYTFDIDAGRAIVEGMQAEAQGAAEVLPFIKQLSPDSEQIKQKSITGGALGTMAAFTATPQKAVAPLVGAKSFIDRLSEGEDFLTAMLGASEDVATIIGVDLATLGLGKVLKKGAPKAKKAAINIMEKLSGLSKKVSDNKITKDQAQKAASELLNDSPFIPSIRNIEKKVNKNLKKTEKELTSIYKESQGLSSGARVVDKKDLAADFKKAGDEIFENVKLPDGNVAKDAKKIKDDLYSLADEVSSRKSEIDIMKAWDMAKDFGSRGYGKNQSVTNTAASEARKILVDRLQGAIGKLDSSGNLINRLRKSNKEASNLLTVIKPLSKKAALKSSALLPSTADVAISAGLGALSPQLSAIPVALRLGRNLGPGVAANVLNKAAPLMEKAAREIKVIKRPFKALTATTLKE